METTWKCHYLHKCKFSQKKGYKCTMILQIFRSQRSNLITAEISDGTHTHFWRKDCHFCGVQTIQQCNYSDWNEFVETNNSIYIIKRSPLNSDFFICSCPVGCKKHPCKHSVPIMEKVEHIIENPYEQSTPIQPKRKPGRPKLAKYALKTD